MLSLEVAVLGTPIITYERKHVSFESNKAIALLAYLAAHPGSHPRAELATLLWPESDQKRARGALRYTLSIIRKGIGDSWLEADNQQIQLKTEPGVKIDLLRFRRLLADVRAHEGAASQAPCRACACKLEAAAALYRGDFLAGFGLRDSVNFDEWQFFQTESLRTELAGTLRNLVRYYRSQDRLDEAAAAARRWLQLDPLQEEVHRELMKLYAAAGQVSAALEQFRTCAEILDGEFGVQPSPQTLALKDQIRRSDTSRADFLYSYASEKKALPHNLPAETLSFVGRDAQLESALSLLTGNECRMLTLLGPGGIGKSRLALKIGHTLLTHIPQPFPQGIYFVPLASVADTAGVIASLADIFGIQFSGARPPTEQLLAHLGQRQLLLILDNMEQLSESASFLDELLSQAPLVKLLLSSRQRLNLIAEWTIEISGLSVPYGVAADAAPTFAAVELFQQRARRINLRFRLRDEEAAVVDICQMVEGMPLAIELAAGWTRALSCAEIANQIRHNLDFLSQEGVGLPDRHRSLRATFLHSWQQLTPEEQSVFARLSLFRGGASLVAAQDVAGATHLILARLLDKSMIRREIDRLLQEDRYTIHELLRQFGLEQLEDQELERRFAEYHVEFVMRLTPQIRTRSEPEVLSRIGSEIGNILASWQLLAEKAKTAEDELSVLGLIGRLCPMFSYFYLRTSRFAEGQQHIETMLESLLETDWMHTPLRSEEDLDHQVVVATLRNRLADFYVNQSQFCKVLDQVDQALPFLQQAERADEIGLALLTRGKALLRQGKYAEAEVALQESYAALQEADDRIICAEALNALGILLSNQGRFEEAETFYLRCLSLYRSTGYERGIANLLGNLGSNSARNGRFEEARPLYEEAYELAKAGHDRLLTAFTLSNLGSVSRQLGEYEKSMRYYEESLHHFRATNELRWTAASLNGMGLTLVDLGNIEGAYAHLLEALQIARSINSIPDTLDALAVLGEILASRGATRDAATVLRFVATHPVTQTLARLRSQAVLEQLSDPRAGEARADGHEEENEGSVEAKKRQRMEDIVALVVNST